MKERRQREYHMALILQWGTLALSIFVPFSKTSYISTKTLQLQ